MKTPERREYERRWREQNRERVQLRAAQYYREHRIEVLARVKAHQDTHRAAIRAQKSEYRQRPEVRRAERQRNRQDRDRGRALRGHLRVARTLRGGGEDD